MDREKTLRRAKLETEAAHWLEGLESGTADVAAFERWRDADPANAAAFAQVDAAWSRLDRLRALRPPGSPDPDLFVPRVQMSRRAWLLRAAAVAGPVVLTAAGVGFVLTGRASAETAVGERRAVRLPDGSLLDLNTDSRASWRFSDSDRRVWLERGEAAVEVAADSQVRPFVLLASGKAVTLATGVFNARLREGGGAEITVVRGEAELPDARPLPENKVVTLTPARIEVREVPEATEITTAWRRGEIVFDGDTLAEAVAEYNRYLADKIEIADPSIADIQLGGRFTTNDPTEFLASAGQAFPIRVERNSAGGVTLSRQ